MAKELNNASSPLPPVGAKIFGADAAGNAGFIYSGDISTRLNLSKVALIGDSQVSAGCNGIGTVTSITQIGGVATITTSSDHYIQVGDKIAVACTGVGCEAYKGVKTVLTVPTARTATYAIDGSAPATATGNLAGWLVNSKFWKTPFNAANAILGNRFNLIVNAGIGGDNSAGVLARIGADVVSFSPTFCIIYVGVNDINASVSANAIAANIDAAATILRNNGILPAISTLPPVGTGNPSADTARRKALIDLNYLIRSMCAEKGYVLLDTYAAIVDPNSSVNDPKVGTVHASPDSLHLTFMGAYLAGKQWAESLDSLCPCLIDTLPKSIGDTWSYGNNIFSDPLINTITGGSLDGFTGVAPADWRVQRTGSMSGVVSTAARTLADDGDTFGKNMVVACVPTAIGEQCNINNNTQAAAAFATSGPGYYVFEGHVQVRDCTVAPSIIGAHVQFTTDGRSIIIFAGGTNGSAYVENGKISLKFKSEPFLIPTGATLIRPFVGVYAGSADPFTVLLGRVALRKVS